MYSYRVTSPETLDYNHIAWAVGENTRCWSPEPFGDYYWPEPVPREETLNAFTILFNLHGYEFCEGNSETFEPGYEKVAIYVDSAGVPKHVARQLETGRWTSKLGRKGHDIEHDTLACLQGENYGCAYRILKRQRD